MAVDLDEYRREADWFSAALNLEYYLQLSGQKARLELEQIYDRYADLLTAPTCHELRESGNTELWRFACEGYLGQLTAPEAERLSELEATLTAELEGVSVPYRMLQPELANEPARQRRELLARKRLELLEELNPISIDALERTREATSELGGRGYRDLYEQFGFPLASLASQCERFLQQTGDIYDRSIDALLRRTAGVSLAEACHWDLPRVWRAERWDGAFPGDRMVSALEATLAPWGIDLSRQRNVELDVAPRPAKDPRAVCSPIEVPNRVVLCVKPIGGVDDWRALFHEAGHAEHFAHTAPHLPLEARRLGDNAVSECWAFLLENLVSDPVWLARRLDLAGAGDLQSDWATQRLLLARGLCATFLYELELYEASDVPAMSERYAERLTSATRIQQPPEPYLERVDPGFYATSYLRALALEALVRAHLQEEFGRDWCWSRKAGTLIRELWAEGQGMNADRIADELTGQPLDLSTFGDELTSVLE